MSSVAQFLVSFSLSCLSPVADRVPPLSLLTGGSQTESESMLSAPSGSLQIGNRTILEHQQLLCCCRRQILDGVEKRTAIASPEWSRMNCDQTLIGLY